MKKIILIILIMQLLACSKGMDGIYQAPFGLAQYEFNSNGVVTITSLGSTNEMGYELDGDEIRIESPQGTAIMILLENGTIKGPMGMILKPIIN